MDLVLRVYPNLDPRIVEILPEDPIADSQDASVQDIYNAIRTWEDEPAGMAYPSMISGAGKEQLGSGVTVGITATLLNTKVMFTARTTPLEQNGACTTTNSKGTTLQADGGQFVTNNIYSGCIVINTTTKSRAAVISVESETELRCFKITGGSNEQWTNGDGYDIHPNVQCNISGGNLVAIDGNGDEMLPVMQSPGVQIIRTSSSSATLQELEAVQFSSYQNGVWVSPTNGQPGTDFPVGTREYPVNNFDDASSIASSRGFNTFYLLESIICSGKNLDGLVIKGENNLITTLTVNGSCSTLGTEFRDMTLMGELNGEVLLEYCKLDAVTGFIGQAHSCILNTALGLAGSFGDVALLLDCWLGSSMVGGVTTIDMNGDGPTLNIRGHKGAIKIINKTGASKVAIDFTSGRIILDSTVTTGTFYLRGVAELSEDNSSGTTLHNLMVSPASVADKTLDDQLSEHVVPGSGGEALGQISEIEGAGQAVSIEHDTSKTVIDRKGDATFPMERTSEINEPIERGN